MCTVLGVLVFFIIYNLPLCHCAYCENIVTLNNCFLPFSINNKTVTICEWIRTTFYLLSVY